MPIPFLLDALIVLLAAASRSWGGAALLLCAAQLWFETAILLNRALFVPSWARLLKFCAVCAALAAPLLGGAAPLSLVGAALGLASLFVDRSPLPDGRVTLLALAPSLLYAAARTAREPAAAARYALALAAAWGIALVLWRLTLRFDGEGVPGDAEPEDMAWTADGYLKDQDALSRYTYRTIPACHNGCGPVAAFNLRRFAGQEARLADVLAELDALHPVRLPGPTFHYVMRRYLRAHLPGGREARGREAALRAASRSRMGVYRYLEQRVPHYVAYIRAGDAFRFFNVSDELEDGVLSMERFGAEHLLGGDVKLIYWE